MAKIVKSNADNFLQDYASTFAWNNEIGLIYAHYDATKKGYRKWAIYHNAKYIRHAEGWKKAMTHADLYSAVFDHFPSYLDTMSSIRGRVTRDGKQIIVHDLNYRDHSPMIAKKFDYFVDKAIDAVYRYMGRRLK